MYGLPFRLKAVLFELKAVVFELKAQEKHPSGAKARTLQAEAVPSC